jgi:hypothetical protein
MEVEVCNARAFYSVVEGTSYAEWSAACTIREDQGGITASDLGMLSKDRKAIPCKWY